MLAIPLHSQSISMAEIVSKEAQKKSKAGICFRLSSHNKHTCFYLYKEAQAANSPRYVPESDPEEEPEEDDEDPEDNPADYPADRDDDDDDNDEDEDEDEEEEEEHPAPADSVPPVH
ncbi:hypothetical protein Tco_1264713, partial [Tanacetum coccineum]